MEIIKDWFEKVDLSHIISSIIIVIVSFIIYKTVTFLLTKGGEKSQFSVFTSKKSKTYLKMLRSMLRYVFIIVTLLILLQINGVNVSSMLAGVGILSVVIGLAIQDALKDIIRGTTILSDNYFNVGDVVKYGEIEGKVVALGLKTTKVESLVDNNIISIANRNIEQIEVLSGIINVNIPMPYELKVDEAEKVIYELVECVKCNPNVKNCEYKAVNELADSYINYLIQVHCIPQFKRQVRRDSLRTALLVLEDNNIAVPYTQIDIHNK